MLTIGLAETRNARVIFLNIILLPAVFDKCAFLGLSPARNAEHFTQSN